MIETGTSFDGGLEPTRRKHLYFVVSDPNINSSEVVIVNITTYDKDKDKSCVIEVGEHGFIRNKSIVNFAESRLCKCEDLIKGFEVGLLKPNAMADKELINKIQIAFLNSRVATPKARELVQKSRDGYK